MKKILTWGVIIIVVLIVIFALGGGDSKVSGPVKIGFIGPLTGDAAAYGEPLRNTIELAVARVNEEGGINGEDVEIVYEDGACEGKTSTNAAQKLINVDKVSALVGLVCSSEALAVIPVAEAGDVFVVSGSASSPDLTGASNVFVRTYPSDATQGAILANEGNKRGWAKVAFITESLDYPQGIQNAFEEVFSDLGGEIVVEEFSSEVTDFRTSLTKLRDVKPDALFISVQTPAAGERVAKQVKDLDWNVQLILADAVSTSADTVEANRDLFEGALAAEFVTEENPEFTKLLSDYSNVYGDELPFAAYGSTMYDSVILLKDAIEEVGTDAKDIAKWMKDVKDWNGASGDLMINDGGDREGGHVLKVIKDGVSVEVGGSMMMEDDKMEDKMEEEN